MMLDILVNDLPSHTVSDRSCEVSIFPQLSTPHPLLQSRKLAEQLSRTYALYRSYHLPDRTPRWKRYQNMHMILCYFHLLYLKSILFCNLSYQLSRSFPHLGFSKRLPPIFRAPHQMVARVVDRMTRPLQSHASCYTIARKGLCGLGSLPVSLITLWARHDQDRGRPQGVPLPHHPACGSAPGGSKS